MLKESVSKNFSKFKGKLNKVAGVRTESGVLESLF